MAVYTPLTDQDVQYICQVYGLGKAISLTPIAQGMENSNYFLSCENHHDLVVTIFEEIQAEQVAFFCQLLQQLQNHNLAVAAPISTVDQHAFIMLHDKPLIICPKVTGHHPKQTTLAQCQTISQALAKFHGFSEAHPQVFTGVRSINWLPTLVESSFDLLDTDDQALVSTTMQQFAVIRELPGLRVGLCHCDLFRDNSLFLDDSLQAVLDFYSASQHYYLFDLAVLINDWAHYEGVNTEKQQAILTAYQALRPLTLDEQQQLPFFLQLAAMRFWLSRVLEVNKSARVTGDIKPFEPCRQLFLALVTD